MRFFSARLLRGPLFDDDAQIVQFLHGRLHIAADLGQALAVGLVRLGDCGHAAITPGADRQRGQRFGQLVGLNLDLAPVGCVGVRRIFLACLAGGGVGKIRAQQDRFRANPQKRIAPGVGVVHAPVLALGGQRNRGQSGALPVQLRGGGLGVVGGVLGFVDRGFGLGDGVLSRTDDLLLLLMASHRRKRQQQKRCGDNRL